MSSQIDLQDPYWFADDEELDEPELHDWEPLCIDDCELCGCHGGCDPEDQWSWAEYEEEDE